MRRKIRGKIPTFKTTTANKKVKRKVNFNSFQKESNILYFIPGKFKLTTKIYKLPFLSWT